MIFDRPKNLYMVHGWLVDDAVRNSMMMDKGADAQELGLTVTISADGKSAFIGRHLGTIDVRDGKDFAGVPIPTPENQKTLEEIAAKLVLGVVGPPTLYVIAG